MKIFEKRLRITKASQGVRGFTNITSKPACSTLEKHIDEERAEMLFDGSDNELSSICFCIPEDHRVAVGDIIQVTFETPGVK
ncbi:MAG: hypothetical protein KAS32_08010 [Candidatus Peribacteraceae bacterium]|nr:hypothetical protein [Candidatus Peribacteraceae bacterium]